MKRTLTLLALLLMIATWLPAQKKPLDHSVYNGWQHIGERMISNDGKWVVYTIDPQEGDNELVIQSSDSAYRKSIPRGYNAGITEDSRFVIFKIKPLYADTREAKIKKKRADDFPKDSFAIVELGKEAIWKKERVRNYKTPSNGTGWVAYQVEKAVEAPAKPRANGTVTGRRAIDSLAQVIDSLRQIILTQPVKRGKRNDTEVIEEYDMDADGDEASALPVEQGYDLILRNLSSGEEVTFAKALEYYFSKKGNLLLVERAKDPLDSNSLHAVVRYDLKNATFKLLSNGGNDFKNFTMTDEGDQIAWFATMLVDKNSVDMKLGMTVSEYGNLNFSKNGKRLFFGVAPIQPPRDTSIVEFEKAKLDIWHYNDDYLQTVQTLPSRLRMAQQENFLAVVDLSSRQIIQLGSKELPQVIQTDEGNGNRFVGVTDYGKRIESQWQGNTLKDIYAIDVNSGNTQLVKQNLAGQVYPSSTGKYIMWYDRKAKHYFVWDGDATKNITAGIKVPLYDEEWDTPDDPNNYGVMGWHEGDSAVYIYDRYDIWCIQPDMKIENLPEYNLQKKKETVAFDAKLPYYIFNDIPGRPNHTSFRYIRTNDEQRYFKSADIGCLRLFQDSSKYAGVSELRFISQWPWQHVNNISAGPNAYSFFNKAKNANIFLYTKESFNASPDLYVHTGASRKVGGSMSSSYYVNGDIRLSSINAQQKEYNWGTVELFKWKAYNGKQATGLVYKPEDFDPKKKYPMIVYFYEKLSDGLYNYKEPAPIRSAVNVPFFVSRGYIIFMPDIEYKTGYPGKGAFDYIVSGARALVKKGWVDSTNMALQGHSWGGYQAAQVATMTKLFKAVWAGAPVANMTSAYGGIRWESGISRQFQYEKTQSRIGGTLWQKLPLYMENSPLFHLEKVTSPMVIMANDADGAVPWYQGIELFSGLRRLGKKVWMFNYNGQGHGLTQRQDMRDYQIRMQQFFDWILKGDKPAKWITEGLPAVKKGKEWGLETVN
ncbi:MAG: prolyl oligopeptidase family serine peptidase [Bacteroidetes bacterium]|nr:prolyl oligopeptidase family serine peptidase [Bacteroidota bacterium]